MGIFGIMRRDADMDASESEIIGNDLVIGSDARAASITKREAMAIPAFAACVDTISGTISTLPIKLYRNTGGNTVEVADDPRVAMLNGDTGDTMTGPEMLKAVVEDYFCSDHGGNIFVNRPNRRSNEIESFHYVKAEDVQPLENRHEPIFKEVAYNVGGRVYERWQFVRILHATRDGRTGRSIITANQEALSVAYMTMLYERSLVMRGGNKRGFLKTGSKLGSKPLKALKEAWRRFYGSTSENVVILNGQMDFQEATATSTEMQLNENKLANSNDIFAMFKMPPEIIRVGGTANAGADANSNYLKQCIMPILRELRAAMDSSILLESEKGSYFFDFDLSEFTKADTKERWESWRIAKEGGFVTTDEVRKRENMPPIGLDMVNLNLSDVFYDPANRRIVVPNTGAVMDIGKTDVSEGVNESETQDQG